MGGDGSVMIMMITLMMINYGDVRNGRFKWRSMNDLYTRMDVAYCIYYS
jgi:hypothetical protein